MHAKFSSSSLIKRRTTLRISQQELSELVEVSQSTFHRWESGLSVPNANQLPALAQALQVTIDFFYYKG